MMPLALLGVGESGTITDIRGKEDVIHHLHNLGFAAGTDVEVAGASPETLVKLENGTLYRCRHDYCCQRFKSSLESWHGIQDYG